MSSRRAFLGAAALAATTAGCSSAADLLNLGSTVRVAVNWSGMELEAFRSVTDALSKGDYRVVPIPFGDEIAVAFRTTPRPDVVMLPQPGLVTTYRAELEPLPKRAAAALDPWPNETLWSELLYHREQWYGMPFKITSKSSVWYRKALFHEEDLPVPQRWSEWVELNEKLRQRGVRPLALPGADGWMLTDFFENVLLGGLPEAYTNLAGHRARLSTEPAVEQALTLLGRLWAPPGTLAGGVRRSLVQQYSDAVVEVFGHHRAAMVVAPDFVEPLVRDYAHSDFGIFTFPTVDGDQVHPVRGGGTAPLVVGGDVAVLTAPASEAARNLVELLAGSQAPLPWIRGYGGFLAANQHDPGAPYSTELRELAGQLTGNPRSIRFDLSDQLGPLGGSEGLWQVVQKFLKDVGERGEDQVPPAVDRALVRLSELEELEG